MGSSILVILQILPILRVTAIHPFSVEGFDPLDALRRIV